MIRKKYNVLLFPLIFFFISGCGPDSQNSNLDSLNNNTEPAEYGFNGPPTPQYTTTYYIRTDASGDGSGSDWTNAYTSIPSTLVRGAVYYLADGNYGSVSLNSDENNTLYTGIKKATDADHGTAIDWSATYGDGIAEFQRIDINNSYIEIDGQAGGGPDDWTTGHGILVNGNWPITEDNGRLIHFKQYISNLIVSHVELTPGNMDGHGHCFYGLDVSEIKINNCYAHDIYGCFILIRRSEKLLLEYNYFINNLSNTANHSEFLSEIGCDNLTIRYNFLKEIDGTAIFAGVNGDPSDPSVGWEIYGNIITASTHFIYYYYFDTDQNEARYWRIYNNTIVNVMPHPDINGRVWFSKATGIEIYNNIWYNFQEPDNYLVMYLEDTDYNSFYSCDFRLDMPQAANNEFLSGDPFDNSGSDIFSLNGGSPTAGMELPAPYNKDMFGNTRGSDGLWERGALEY